MGDEHDIAPSLKKQQRIPYVIGMAAAVLAYGLSHLEPSIQGPRLWLVFILSSFAVWISVLKLRNLIHGVGWTFPRTDTALLMTIVVEVWLHLWFAR